jgi:hypothetical protein
VTEREAHVLVVAHKTAATPRLLEEVRRRAEAGSCRFTLLVPRPYWNPDTDEADVVLELALPLLERAAGAHVEGRIGSDDPVEAVRDLLATEHFDEIIISTLPQRVSRWLHRDVPAKVQALGLPVTVITAEQSARRLVGSG